MPRGAPKGNKNAQKHGGYAPLGPLSPEEKKYLMACGDPALDEEAMLQHEIGLLTIRIVRMLKMLNKYTGGLYVDSVETTERKRHFESEEEKELYRQRVQDEIQRGDRKPGETYTVRTTSCSEDDFALKIHEVLNRAQALRLRCIESLERLREQRKAESPTTDIEDLVDLRDAVFGDTE